MLLWVKLSLHCTKVPSVSHQSRLLIFGLGVRDQLNEEHEEAKVVEKIHLVHLHATVYSTTVPYMVHATYNAANKR